MQPPRLTSADSAIGTLGYVAPEQLAGADPAYARQALRAVREAAAEVG